MSEHEALARFHYGCAARHHKVCCADLAGVGRVSGKSRHLENTALLFVWPSISQIYFGAVPRARDPVQPNLVEQIAADAYPPDCHNAAVLTHADNRIVSAIGDVKIGPLVQARVASPIDVVRIYFDGRQVDRQIQCERGDAFNPTLWAREDLAGRHPEDDEIDHRYRVVERLADEKLPHHWRLSVGIHEHAEPGVDAMVGTVPTPPDQRPHRSRGREPVEARPAAKASMWS
jgi:hypothetical protein